MSSQNKGKKTAKIIYIIAMILILTIFSVAIIHQYLISVELNEQKAQLLSEISKEEAIGNSLKNQQENQDSPEFIEKIAREKLNMVKPNEIVFIDKNNPNNKSNLNKQNTQVTTEAPSK